MDNIDAGRITDAIHTESFYSTITKVLVMLICTLILCGTMTITAKRICISVDSNTAALEKMNGSDLKEESK